ncbi:MAG TPA: ABC transporter permease [Puia sp.]|jgi:ABC-type antimicrobial peptide transport system permease subunit|nr:ABC transporter permease [Puia sp.]
MFRNYFRSAFRNIRRNMLFAALNIFGLSIGLASAILIFLWVRDELSYDRFNPNAAKIFRLTAQVKDIPTAANPAAFGRIGNAIPAIGRVTRIQADQKIITAGDRKFDERHLYHADTNFLLLFHYPLLRGDRTTALTAPNSVVLTASTAIKYFGSVDKAMNNPIFIDNDSVTAKVTGVLQDIPANSHLQFDMLLPIQDMDDATDPSHGWRFFDSYVYYELAGPVSPTPTVIRTVQRQLNDMRARAIAGTPAVPATFSLQPLTDIHLRSRFTIDLAGMGDIQYVRIFILIAILIVIIACINFINLATAVAGTRAKEVGLRKTVGALRYQLAGQFIGESVLLAFLALVIALALVAVALPFFNTLTAKSITLNLLDLRLVISVLAITTAAGLLAGCYPAFYLSSLDPIRILKGNTFFPGRGSWLRNGLVILQFAVSVVLMISTIIVGHQLRYLHNRDIGFDRNDLLYIPLPSIGDRKDDARALRSVLSQSSTTGHFTIISDLPTDLAGTRPLSWPGMDNNSMVLCHYMNVDANTLKTFGMRMAAGHFYPPGFQGNDSIYDYVVNETTVRLMGKSPETAVGSRIAVRGLQGAIIGVVRDFNFRPVHQAVEPLVMRAYPAGYYAVVRATAGQMRETVSAVQRCFEKVYGNTPFSYGFIDQDLDHLYMAESRMGSLLSVFSVLAILISCLGLFGLAAFTTQRRTREIGVRKVLGAAEINIVALLTKEFLGLVALALLVAFPLAWYFMHQWLQGFVYRVDMGAGVFVVAGGLAILIAFSTVSFQTIRAALANPVRSLRTE